MKQVALEALKAHKRRTTEKLLQKLGQSDETRQDETLNELQNDFNMTHKQLAMLLSKFQLYVDALERWQRCGEALSKEVVRFASTDQKETDEKEGNCSRAAVQELSRSFSSTQEQIAVVCSDMVDTWSSQILSPLRDITLTFNAEVTKEFNTLALDKLDFDAYRRRAKSAPSGGGKQAAAAKRNITKLAITQDRYESNHAYLVEELTRMQRYRSEIVADELALAVCSQQQFLNSVLKAYQDGFGDTLERFLPADENDAAELLPIEPNGESSCSPATKRRNRWLRNGPARTRVAAGYEAKSFKATPVRTPTKASGMNVRPTRLDLVSSAVISDAESARSPCSNTVQSPVSSPAAAKSRPRFDRSQSTRHYVRNAKRGKHTLKTIGKQISLTGLDMISRKKNNTLTADFTLPPPQETDAGNPSSAKSHVMQVDKIEQGVNETKKSSAGLKEERDNTEACTEKGQEGNERIELKVESTSKTEDHNEQELGGEIAVTVLESTDSKGTELESGLAAQKMIRPLSSIVAAEKISVAIPCEANKVSDEDQADASDKDFELAQSKSVINRSFSERTIRTDDGDESENDSKALVHVMDVDTELAKTQGLDRPHSPVQVHTSSAA